jgi:flagellar hook-length control protein FliK
MAVTTVNSTDFNASSILNATAINSGKKVTGITQDFGAVLNSTTQNSKSQQDTTTTKVDKTEKTFSVNDSKASEASEDDEPIKAKADEATSDTVDNQESEEADDETIEAVATALTNILDQLKEILNVDDDTIAVTMEDLELTPSDLLESGNLAELVTALSGEESVISLVADEGLYDNLQALTEIVDTQLETLLDNTGLSEDELSAVLENYGKAISSGNEEEEVIASPTELVADNDVEEDEPVYIVEDNTTKSTDTTYTKLPENQQDTTELKDDTASDNNSKTDKSAESEQKDYSANQSLNQNNDTAINENVTEVAEDVTSYTSESTESIMRQLADTVKLIKDENMTQMELQLHPASLGTVNISLIAKGGAITAQFTTQSEQVRAAIESQATQLQSDLEAQGVKVEAIEVTVESHQMERNLDENNNRQEKNEQKAQESIKATRRHNINLRMLGDDGDVLEEIQGADDATRIAMELMSARGNSMDMLA